MANPRIEVQSSPARQTTLLAYYQCNDFNPARIPVERAEVWPDHVQKRTTLYTRHLHLPLPLWRGASVLEFGANSGENALVAAMAGARLTLVEPNVNVHDRLRGLFSQFSLSDQLESLSAEGLEEFTSQNTFDGVIAEGFVFTLPNRLEMLAKLASLVRPGGFLVISYMDRLGGFIEALRKLYLLRGCALARVALDDPEDVDALARQFFFSEFSTLFPARSASRGFEAWCRDTFINPLVTGSTLWSLPEFLPVLESHQCELLSTSPQWSRADHYQWYKKTPTTRKRHEFILEERLDQALFFLTGRAEDGNAALAGLDAACVAEIEEFVNQAHDTIMTSGDAIASLKPPPRLQEALAASSSHAALGQELADVIGGLQAKDVDTLLRRWRETKTIKALWGTPYHYVSFLQFL